MYEKCVVISIAVSSSRLHPAFVAHLEKQAWAAKRLRITMSGCGQQVPTVANHSVEELRTNAAQEQNAGAA